MKAARSSPQLIIGLVIVIPAVLLLAVLHALQAPASSGPIGLRPVPVPAPLAPVARQAPVVESVSAAQAEAIPVPHAVPAPRPPSSGKKMASSSVQDKPAAASLPVRLPGPQPLAVVAALLISVLLLALAWLRTAPAPRSMHHGCLQ